MRTTFGSTLWSISRTSPSSMMLRLISGSTTCSSAVRISSSVAIWVPRCRCLGAPRAPRLVRKSDVELVPLDPHRIRTHRRHGRKRECLSGPDVEPGAVPRTDDLMVLQLPLRQRPPVVRTDVVDGVEPALDAEYRDLPVLHVEDLRPPFRHVARLADAHEPRGGRIRHSSSSPGQFCCTP